MNTIRINQLTTTPFSKAANLFVPAQGQGALAETYRVSINDIITTSVDHNDVQNKNADPNFQHISSTNLGKVTGLFGLADNTIPIISGGVANSGIIAEKTASGVSIRSSLSPSGGLGMFSTGVYISDFTGSSSLYVNDRQSLMSVGGANFLVANRSGSSNVTILNPSAGSKVFETGNGVTSLFNTNGTNPGVLLEASKSTLRAPSSSNTFVEANTGNHVNIFSNGGVIGSFSKGGFGITTYNNMNNSREAVVVTDDNTIISARDGASLTLNTAGTIWGHEVGIFADQIVSVSGDGGIGLSSYNQIALSGGLTGMPSRLLIGSQYGSNLLQLIENDTTSRLRVTNARVHIENDTSFHIEGLNTGTFLLSGTSFTSTPNPINEYLVRDVSGAVKVLPRETIMEFMLNPSGGVVEIGVGSSSATIGSNSETVSIGYSSENIEVGHQADVILIGPEAGSIGIGSQAGTVTIGHQAGNVTIGSTGGHVVIGPSGEPISLEMNVPVVEDVSNIYWALMMDENGKIVKITKSKFRDWLSLM